MNENDNPRAEDVLPGGYRPHVIDLAARTSTDDEPMIVAQGDLRATAEALGSIELLATILHEDGPDGSPIARQIADMARFWQRHVRMLAGGAAVLALSVVGVMLPAGAPAAQAAEGPQPDPVAASTVASGVVYRVTLDRRYPTLAVPFVTTQRVQGGATGGFYCGSVWTATWSPLGYQCSTTPAFTVTAHLDGAALPVGKSTIILVDEATDNAVSATLEVRRPSRFGRGTWIDRGNGDIEVIAPISMYSPAAGAWLPQRQAPVQVQERTRRGWRTRATMTSCNGVAAGIVHLGGGVHIVRVSRPLGATVTAATGTTRTVNVTTEPLDVN